MPKYRLGTEALRGKAGKKDESAKERITTVNFAFNATGTIKTPLQVINKSKKPKCFLANGGVTWDPKKHGITYYHNPTAWQTRETFTSFLDNFSLQMHEVFKHKTIPFTLPEVDECDEHVLNILAVFLMDNHASHIPVNAEQFKINTAFLYKDILGIFLPPNTTSVVQPLVCFKRKWRAKLVSWLQGKGGTGLGTWHLQM